MEAGVVTAERNPTTQVCKLNRLPKSRKPSYYLHKDRGKMIFFLYIYVYRLQNLPGSPGCIWVHRVNSWNQWSQWSNSHWLQWGKDFTHGVCTGTGYNKPLAQTCITCKVSGRIPGPGLGGCKICCFSGGSFITKGEENTELWLYHFPASSLMTEVNLLKLWTNCPD